MEAKSLSVESERKTECSVHFAKRKDELIYLRIIWSGEASRWPSTSNHRQIGRTKAGKPFVMKSASQVRDLEKKTAEYLSACSDKSIYPGSLSFGRRRTVGVLALSDLHARGDSHNYSKPVGDWLEKVQIIENDRALELISLRAITLGITGCYTVLEIWEEGEVVSDLKAFWRKLKRG